METIPLEDGLPSLDQLTLPDTVDQAWDEIIQIIFTWQATGKVPAGTDEDWSKRDGSVTLRLRPQIDKSLRATIILWKNEDLSLIESANRQVIGINRRFLTIGASVPSLVELYLDIWRPVHWHVRTRRNDRTPTLLIHPSTKNNQENTNGKKPPRPQDPQPRANRVGRRSTTGLDRGFTGYRGIQGHPNRPRGC